MDGAAVSGMSTEDQNGLLTPQLEALMGLYMLHGKLLKQVESMNFSKPISKQERHLLIRLAKPQRIGDVARDLSALPSTLTSLANGLCAKGLLTRRPDPSDRRAHLIELTPEGDTIRARLTAKAATVFEVEAGLSPDQAEAFTALLQNVRAHLAATHSEQDVTPCE